MRLYRIHLNPRCKEARRDLADPYQMHASLCRAFSPPEVKCPAGAILWRLEPETDRNSLPRVLIQSALEPDWSRSTASDWLAYADPGLDLPEKLGLATLMAGQSFRFRLRANPCKTVAGKRQGLMAPEDQIAWLGRKAARHGFLLHEPQSADYFEFAATSDSRTYFDCRATQAQMLRARQHDGNTIRVFSVLFEGRLRVADVALFRQALAGGIGHGKSLGQGLLSVLPLRE